MTEYPTGYVDSWTDPRSDLVIPATSSDDRTFYAAVCDDFATDIYLGEWVSEIRLWENEIKAMDDHTGFAESNNSRRYELESLPLLKYSLILRVIDENLIEELN